MSQLDSYFSVAQAISSVLYPYGEVVIHDLKTGQIAAIYNNFSKRKVGDPSLIEESEDYTELPDVFPVYSQINSDGRQLKSSTATLRDIKGKPIGLLCINLDISKWTELHHCLGEWLGNFSQQKRPEVLFKDDWRENINTYVSRFLIKEGLNLKTLNKEKKQDLIKALQREGAFKAKNAASYVAEVLGVSRATIYNYLR